MAEAKMHDGRAIVAYRDGKAIDSEGRVIDGAPGPTPDSKPRPIALPMIPGQPAQLSLLPGNAVEEMGKAMGTALAGALRTIREEDRAAAEAEAKKEAERADDPDPLPRVDELEAFLKGVMDPATVLAMQERDSRKTAAPLYEARFAELTR